MNDSYNTSHISIEADDTREAAELVALELRKSGFDVSPAMLVQIQEQIEEQLRRIRAGERLTGMIGDRFEVPIRELSRRWSMTRGSTNSSVIHGG